MRGDPRGIIHVEMMPACFFDDGEVPNGCDQLGMKFSRTLKMRVAKIDEQNRTLDALEGRAQVGEREAQW